MSAVFRSHHILPALPPLHPSDGAEARSPRRRRRRDDVKVEKRIYRVARQDFSGTAAFFASEVSPIKCAGREFAGILALS